MMRLITSKEEENAGFNRAFQSPYLSMLSGDECATIILTNLLQGIKPCLPMCARCAEKTLLKWKNAIERFLGRENETEVLGNLGNIKGKGAMPCARERSVARSRKN